MNLPLLSLALALSLSPALLQAQREPAPEGPRPQRRPLNPGQPRMGPWNRDLQLLRSRDGQVFSEPKTFAERGGVPCLAQDAKGRLFAVFQWFPMERREDFDRIAIKYSDDNGATWSEPRRIEFLDLPEEYPRQFDPTLVALEDGRYRLYFTSSRGREPGRDNTAIYSAVSTNALQFTFEPGARFAVPEEDVVDCAVARLGDSWHLYAPLPRQEGRAYHATSKDGLKFERQPDVSADVSGTWIGNVLNVDGALRFYGSGRGGVWSAQSPEGLAWEVTEGNRARGGDPAVWRLKDGNYLMVVTGDARADAPMDPPWRRDARPPVADLPPPDGGRPRNAEFTPPTNLGVGDAAITVADGFLYVLRDGVLYQYGARDLNFIRQATLPEGRRGQRPQPFPNRPNRDGDVPSERPRP